MLGGTSLCTIIDTYSEPFGSVGTFILVAVSGSIKHLSIFPSIGSFLGNYKLICSSSSVIGSSIGSTLFNKVSYSSTFSSIASKGWSSMGFNSSGSGSSYFGSFFSFLALAYAYLVFLTKLSNDFLVAQ